MVPLSQTFSVKFWGNQTLFGKSAHHVSL